MQIKSLLIITILLCLFAASPVYSQANDTKEVDFFPGTWSGMVVRVADTKTKEAISTFMEIWRIHNVDRNKNQMQMTASSFRMQGGDTVTIKKPRMTYPFRIEDKFLVVQIKDIETDIPFTLKLLIEKQKGVYILQGETEKLPPKDEKLIYGLGKMDNDTTNVLQGFIPTPTVAPKKQ